MASFLKKAKDKALGKKKADPPAQHQNQGDGVVYPPPLNQNNQPPPAPYANNAQPQYNPGYGNYGGGGMNYPPPAPQAQGNQDFYNMQQPSAPPLHPDPPAAAPPPPQQTMPDPEPNTGRGTLARLGQVLWGRSNQPSAPPAPPPPQQSHPPPQQAYAQPPPQSHHVQQVPPQQPYVNPGVTPAAYPTQQQQPAVRDWKMRAVRGMWNFAVGGNNSSNHSQPQQGRPAQAPQRRRPEYVWMRPPARERYTQGDSGYYYSPSLTTIGLQDSVSWCVDLAIQEEREERIARGDREDSFGDGGYRKRLDTAMRADLCCLCVGILFFFERLFLGIFCGLVMLLGNLGATLLRLPQTFFSFYKNIIFKSPRFGPFLKTLMAIFFFIPALLSLATVPVISLLIGLCVPFFNHPHNSAVIAFKSVKMYFTRGFEARETCYGHYVIPGTYYEIAIFHLLSGLLIGVFGLVTGCLGYLLISLFGAPKIFLVLSMSMWSDADVNDECFFCTVPARVLGTVLMFLGSIIQIPLCTIYGLFSGLVVGMDNGYNDPRNSPKACLLHVKSFYEGLRDWLAKHYDAGGAV